MNKEHKSIHPTLIERVTGISSIKMLLVHACRDPLWINFHLF